MKKIASIILTVCLLFSVWTIVPVSAATVTENSISARSGNYTYSVLEDGTVEISQYTGSASELIIPSTLGGRTVTSIRYKAFENCVTLTSITIPDSVTNIGGAAFYNCSRLTSITIPDGVTSIGDNAFEDCESLTSITIPDSVTKIGNSAFEDCESLTSITIPDSVTSIGDSAFYNCSSLTSITIPDGVTSIRNWTFVNCSSLTSITIPDSVTSIGKKAFYETAYYNDNNNWENDVLYIDHHLIRAKNIPDNYRIKDNTLTIAGNAFEDCIRLTSITIPDSVTSIGDSAFEDCSSLTSITIPDSVTSIGASAFYNCLKLTSITIPDSVTSVGNMAFDGCLSLTDVYYAGTEDEWKRITVGSGNEPPLNATIHYNSSGPSSTEKSLYFAVSSGTNVLAKGDEITCAVSKTEGNLKGDSYSNGQSCPILRWVSSDENVIKVTDSHAEYSRSEVKAVGYGTATLTFYAGSVKVFEATLNVISPTALKDNAAVTVLKQANKNSNNILCDYDGWDRTKFVVADTSMTFFSDMSGTYMKVVKQALGQMGDDTDLAQDDVIKEIMKKYFEYSNSKSDAVSDFKKDWKYVKTGMKLAKTVYDNSKNETQAKKTVAKAVEKASKVTDSDFDKVFKRFKTVKGVVGDSLKLYELSATAIMLEEFDKEIVWELMNSFDTYSSTYHALKRLYNDMETDPVGYVIENFMDEKITQLLEKLVDAAFSSVEMPKAVVETAFSILSLVYEGLGGVTVKAFDKATVAADFAEEALSALTSCTDSSKREMLFNYCTSAAKVELDKCIAVCKSDSTTLENKANDSLKKVNMLTYEKYIENSVKSFSKTSDIKSFNAISKKSIVAVGAADIEQDIDTENAFVIPSSIGDSPVSSIADDSYENLEGITVVYVPNTIQQIGARAFYNCADTKEITLGNNVTMIGDEAFMNCASLTDINLCANIQSIGESAFENCSSLSEIKIAKDVTILGENAFAGCSVPFANTS